MNKFNHVQINILTTLVIKMPKLLECLLLYIRASAQSYCFCKLVHVMPFLQVFSVCVLLNLGVFYELFFFGGGVCAFTQSLFRQSSFFIFRVVVIFCFTENFEISHLGWYSVQFFRKEKRSWLAGQNLSNVTRVVENTSQGLFRIQLSPRCRNCCRAGGISFFLAVSTVVDLWVFYTLLGKHTVFEVTDMKCIRRT